MTSGGKIVQTQQNGARLVRTKWIIGIHSIVFSPFCNYLTILMRQICAINVMKLKTNFNVSIIRGGTLHINIRQCMILMDSTMVEHILTGEQKRGDNMMKFVNLVISGCCAAFLIGCGKASKEIERYEQTASSFLCFVNRMQDGQQKTVLEQDAWGRKLLVETNSSSIVYISQGTDVEDSCDDIRLQIERHAGSYSISYMYGSRHYFSAGFFEPENVGAVPFYDRLTLPLGAKEGKQ